MPSPAARLALAHEFQPQDTPPQTTLLMRIAFVIAALVVYRIGTHIPLPGIDSNSLAQVLPADSVFSLLSSAMRRLSIFSLGVWPYVSASLVMLCLLWLIPPFAAMTKTRRGRLRFNEIIRALTVLIAGYQGYGIARSIGQISLGNGPLVSEPGLIFQLQVVATCAGAALFLVWLAERITARGLGDGVLLLMFTDIVADLPELLTSVLELVQRGTMPSGQAYFLGALTLAAIVCVVFIELARRRVPLVRPGSASGQAQTYLPLHLNPSGLSPLFIAPAFPAMATAIAYQFAPIWFEAEGKFIFGLGSPGDFAITVALILLFGMAFRTICGGDPAEIAARIGRSGAHIPGMLPGASTEMYIAQVQTRIAGLGALYLTAVGLLPSLLQTDVNLPFTIGSWPLLVVVIVPLAVLEGVRGAPRGGALL
jgi:preprotein translocase subunit SecY